ncbi:methyl-accepting chemotaxis protein [Cellulomonas denverensis]|uniref:Methyl-accepting chemotaxis protein n=1 Tax=Cellulomonas denverensis TaxID=264297 RepID=A0A7X6R0L9_9CELL|nr:methyl-accepting chemotaxis protein [Cellulomonas denverensis]NKY24459.1 methyl-accepting chemotaxis protein [Cellulomonas denverensis]
MGSWFENRSLRTKVAAAVLASTATGVVVGLAGIGAVRQLNADSAEAQRSNFTVMQAAGSLAENVEAFNKDQNALALYPALEDALTTNLEADRAAVDDALQVLQTELAADAEGRELVAKTAADWQAYVEFVSVDRSGDSAEELAESSKEYQALGDAVASDRAALEDISAQRLAETLDRGSDLAVQRTVLIAALLVAGAALSLLIGEWVARRVRRTVTQVTRLAEGLAEGDLTRSSGVTTRDEVGRMAAALDAGVGRLRDVVVQVAGTATTLQHAATELTLVSKTLDEAALATSAQAGSVAAASSGMSHDLQTVSAGSAQVGAAISAIRSSTHEAAQVAAQAVDMAVATNTIVSRLGDSSSEIATVVKVITSIAEQTNLLALNATIEAARAGEFGKGFAVVAGEVKELAQETAKATEDIAGRVQSIQTDTSGAVSAIGEISSIIERINGIQLTITSAVEQQAATTHEMSGTLSRAAGGADGIAASIGDVSAATHRTTESVSTAREAADGLAATADELHLLVSQFRY